jgi:serine/threonine-protein kinase
LAKELFVSEPTPQSPFSPDDAPAKTAAVPTPSEVPADLPVTQELPELPDDPGSSGPIPATPKPIMLGKFRLLALLGEGGMGKVVRAEDTSLKRQVALKCLKKSAASTKSYKPEQFIREARAAAALEHPHIVQIYETGEAAGYYYIAMELVEGGTLGALVKACGPLDLARGCQLAAEAADAIAFASQHGITHRDIKPGNLMLSRAGRCKVTDFGLAHINDPSDGFAMPKGAVGTPAYIAPEVLNGFPATAKSDVYSLACTTFFLLTGKTPFYSKDKAALLRMHLDMPPPDITTLRPDLPESLAKVLVRALSKNPDDRPGPDTFAKQLRAHTIPLGASQSMQITSTGPFVPAPPMQSSPQPVAYQSPTSNRRKPLVMGGIIGGAVLLLGLLVMLVLTLGHSTTTVIAPGPAAAPIASAPPAPAPAPAPAADTPAADDTAAPAVAAAPGARRTPAGPPASAELKASDTNLLIAAANTNPYVGVTGTVEQYTLPATSDGDAIATFKDAPDFTLIVPHRLFSPMTKEFGGKSGNGIVGKTVHFTGDIQLVNNKPTLTLSTTKVINAVP